LRRPVDPVGLAEFGIFRAPTGVSPRARQEAGDLDPLRREIERVSLKLGRRLRFLVGKPGLDGHSNGAEQIAARATDAGMDVVYDGIRVAGPTRLRRASLVGSRPKSHRPAGRPPEGPCATGPGVNAISPGSSLRNGGRCPRQR
jgi:hypothetical protein